MQAIQPEHRRDQKFHSKCDLKARHELIMTEEILESILQQFQKLSQAGFEPAADCAHTAALPLNQRGIV